MIGYFIGGPIGGVIDYGASYSISIEVGTFTLTGQNAGYNAGLSAETGVFTLTGNAAELTPAGDAAVDQGGGGDRLKKPAKKKRKAKPAPVLEEKPEPPLTEADLPPIVPDYVPAIVPPPPPPAWFLAMQQDARDVEDAMAFLAMLPDLMPDPERLQREQDERDLQDAMQLLKQIPEQAARDEARDLEDIRSLLQFA